MKNIVFVLAMTLSSTVFADGFVCESNEENLNIKVYNQTQPQLGTRNAAVMVVSDPRVASGRATIATFESADSLLTNDSSTYTSLVDLRYKNSNRKGENIAGTKLGELKYIVLHVNFSYAHPVAVGTRLAGEVTLVKRSGETIPVDMVCFRYLKN